MFSIVIPTMQKNTKILSMLLNQLDKNALIGEIIVIDNSLQGLEFNSDKIKVIVPKENLYVNPSWNLGVKTAKYDYVGILNDDVIFTENYFEQVLKFLTDNPSAGLLGSDTIPVTSVEDFDSYPQNSELEFIKIDKRCSCWGIAMFFRKSKYVAIPDELKIWFGDDFLFWKSCNNYKISNSNIKHVHSLTSDMPQFRIYKEEDLYTYKKINPSYVEEKNINFLQKIFSVKNDYENRQKRKVIYILGFKISHKI